MSELKSRPPGKKAKDLDAFLSGADEKTDPEKVTQKRKPKYSWESPSVREDVNKIFNLRLSEPYLLKLKYIAQDDYDKIKELITSISMMLNKLISKLKLKLD